MNKRPLFRHGHVENTIEIIKALPNAEAVLSYNCAPLSFSFGRLSEKTTLLIEGPSCRNVPYIEFKPFNNQPYDFYTCADTSVLQYQYIKSRVRFALFRQPDAAVRTIYPQPYTQIPSDYIGWKSRVKR